jgi:hypothetical protein
MPDSTRRVRTLPGQRLVNLVVRALLRSPLVCRIVGRRLVTLYVVGRKSGRVYSVPVAYMVDGDDLVLGTSFSWGRNLRTGQLLAIRLRGRRRWAEVRSLATQPDVVDAYAHMARLNRTFARFNNIRLDADSEPDRDDLHQAWTRGARAVRLAPVTC